MAACDADLAGGLKHWCGSLPSGGHCNGREEGTQGRAPGGKGTPPGAHLMGGVAVRGSIPAWAVAALIFASPPVLSSCRMCCAAPCSATLTPTSRPAAWTRRTSTSRVRRLARPRGMPGHAPASRPCCSAGCLPDLPANQAARSSRACARSVLRCGWAPAARSPLVPTQSSLLTVPAGTPGSCLAADYCAQHGVGGEEVAALIRQRVQAATRLTCSGGRAWHLQPCSGCAAPRIPGHLA